MAELARCVDGEHDRIATTRLSKMANRQVAAGVTIPFWSDNNFLFLTGKGRRQHPVRVQVGLALRQCLRLRAYKVVGSSIEPIEFIVLCKVRHVSLVSCLFLFLGSFICCFYHRCDALVCGAGSSGVSARRGVRDYVTLRAPPAALSLGASTSGQRSRARAYTRFPFSGTRWAADARLPLYACGPLPERWADPFQSDIFPPAPSAGLSLSATEFFADKTAPLRLVRLERGVGFASKNTLALRPPQRRRR
ncbi:Coronin [Mycena venus]|uniref:Coronin n=1 Tax=Mycena venus TaxID=2733690 RepID=A0A8H7CZP1_9AGAR|nr:Coronin [Mycena venus]